MAKPTLDEAMALLEEAHKVLEDRWFIFTDDDEYNDDEVIAIDKKIRAFLYRRSDNG